MPIKFSLRIVSAFLFWKANNENDIHKANKKVFSTQWNGYAIVLLNEPEICPLLASDLISSPSKLSQWMPFLLNSFVKFIFINLSIQIISCTDECTTIWFQVMHIGLNCTLSDCDNGRIMHISWQYWTTLNSFKTISFIFFLSHTHEAIAMLFFFNVLMKIVYHWHSRNFIR